jgi:hypothetical protein
MIKNCKDCAYHSAKLYCSNPISPVNKVNFALDLDPIIDEYGELTTQELCAIGWASHCNYFVPQYVEEYVLV